jgi:hypothetical protein
MITHVVYLEDGIHLTLRRKMTLNGYSVHFVECGITPHTKKLWMNVSSFVMVVRILITLNNHTV